jgi:4-hydroxybenzoate polyprenyltransferase
MTTSAVHGSRGLASALAQVVGSSRPLSWINTAYPFGAAYLLSGGGVDEVFVLGVLYFLVPYNLLMYGVNDVFDYESDIRNPRKGGVEGVVLDRSVHRLTLALAAATNLPFLVLLVLLGDRASTLALAVSIFAVVAYSAPGLRFKERPVLDSVTSSTHFVSPAVFGLLLAGGGFGTSTVAALAGFFLWGIGSQAFGAVQDIEADRGGGIASVATWLGASGTVRMAFAAYAVAGLLLLTLDRPAWLAGLLALPYLANVAPYLTLVDRDCERAHAGWQRFLWLNYVTGFLLTQLLIWVSWGG